MRFSAPGTDGPRLIGKEAMLFLFAKVEEEDEIPVENLRGIAHGFMRADGAIGAHFQRQAIQVGRAAHARGINAIRDMAHRRENRIDRDGANRHMRPILQLCRYKTGTELDFHFDIQR